MSGDLYGEDRSVFDSVLLSLADTWETQAAAVRKRNDDDDLEQVRFPNE